MHGSKNDIKTFPKINWMPDRCKNSQYNLSQFYTFDVDVVTKAIPRYADIIDIEI